MTTIRERLEAYWSGERPDRIPFTTYENKIPTDWSDPVIRKMLREGLGVLRFVPTYEASYDSGIDVIHQSGHDGQRAVAPTDLAHPFGRGIGPVDR